MMTFGHTAIAYLISQIPGLKGKPLKWPEILFIILCGNIFDLDFFVPLFYGYPAGSHHYFPTHTPLAGLVYFIVLYLIFRKKLSKEVFLLGGLAILTHLVFDDFNYWLYLIGLEKAGSQQVFWLYPFDPNRALAVKNGLDYFASRHLTTIDIAKAYILKAPKLAVMEIIFTVSATMVYIKARYFPS
jgi:hypothetical protein